MNVYLNKDNVSKYRHCLLIHKHKNKHFLPDDNHQNDIIFRL